MFTAQLKFKVKSLKLKIVWLILSIFTFYFLQFTFPKISFAQTPSAISHQPSASGYTPINPSQVPPQSPVYTNLMVYNLIHSLSCLGIGQSVIGQPCVDYLAQLDSQGKVSTIPVLSSVNTSGGLLGATGSLLTGLFTNPPLRTADYLADLGKGFGIIPEAHAQVGGSGSGVLNPILKLWQVSRNLAYLFLIFIFIIIGLMVMFRQKINPQTVITAQAALPGLILGLILITFSYFFAALISDTAFLGTNLVGYYFTAAQPPPPPGTSPAPNLVEKVADQNVLKIFSSLTGIVNQSSVASALTSFWDGLADPNVDQKDPRVLDPQRVITILSSLLMVQLVMPIASLGGGVTQLLIGGPIALAALKNPTGMIAYSLAFIGMAILIYSMLKLLLRLVNNFLSIIFLTITAPFQFLAASLPGRQGIATAWMLNMLCNVLAFPAVLAVFYFVAFLLGKTNIPAITIVSTNATITSNATFPLLGGLNLEFINILLAFGALVASPKIPDIICAAIGRVGQAGQLLGQEIGGAAGAGRGYAGQFQQGIGGMSERLGPVTNQPGYQMYEGRIHRTYDPRFGMRTGFLGKLGSLFRPPRVSPPAY